MEMMRVLRVGGRCLVYVWARDQRRGERNSTYLSEKRTSKAGEDSEDRNEECRPFGLPVHTNRSNFKHSDLLVPWKMVSVLAVQLIIPLIAMIGLLSEVPLTNWAFNFSKYRCCNIAQRLKIALQNRILRGRPTRQFIFCDVANYRRLQPIYC